MQLHRGTIRNFLAGILIGIGCILPGVSGGVMAVSFGLYRPMLDAVLDFFHAPRRHLRFLTPLAFGGGLGMLTGARLLAEAIERYRAPMLFLFTGFILGGIPQLLREAEKKERFCWKWLWALAGGIGLALPLAAVSAPLQTAQALSPIQSLLTGVLEGIGTVVPGISTSFVLLRLGWYDAYLNAFSTLNLHMLIPVALGFAASALLCMRAVRWLFDHRQGYACYAVLGFLLASVALVFPGFGTGAVLWAEIAMLIIGLVCSGWFH